MKLRSFVVMMCALGFSCASGAFAASALVVTDDLAAGVDTVATCDPTPSDWLVEFGEAGAATTTSVSVSNIGVGCQNMPAELTVTGAGNAALAEVGGTIATCSTTCSITFTVSVTTTSIGGIAMVVTG